MIESWIPLAAALVLAASIGLDLYLTLLLIALAPLGGWEVPASLAGLSTTLVVALAGSLWIMEFVVERVPAVAGYWHLVQSLARAIAAALMAYLLLAAVEVGPSLMVVAALTAAAVAALVHAAKLGWTGLASWSSSRMSTLVVISVGEDAVVLGLTALALERPVDGAIAVTALLVLLALAGRALVRMGGFSHFLAWSRSWESLRPPRWRSEEDLVADLAGEVAAIPRPLGHRLKVTRAGGVRIPASGLFRPGWLVVGPADPRWICRTLRGPRMYVLDPGGPLTTRVKPLYLQVCLGEPANSSLILPRGGPNLESVMSEIGAVAAQAVQEHVVAGSEPRERHAPGTQRPDGG